MIDQQGKRDGDFRKLREEKRTNWERVDGRRNDNSRQKKLQRPDAGGLLMRGGSWKQQEGFERGQKRIMSAGEAPRMGQARDGEKTRESQIQNDSRRDLRLSFTEILTLNVREISSRNKGQPVKGGRVRWLR